LSAERRRDTAAGDPRIRRTIATIAVLCRVVIVPGRVRDGARPGAISI
jgi:hypothetical protein